MKKGFRGTLVGWMFVLAGIVSMLFIMSACKHGTVTSEGTETNISEAVPATETETGCDNACLRAQLEELQRQLAELSSASAAAAAAEPAAAATEPTPAATVTNIPALTLGLTARINNIRDVLGDGGSPTVPTKIADIFVTFATAPIHEAGFDGEIEMHFCKDNAMTDCLRYKSKPGDFIEGINQWEQGSIERYSVKKYFIPLANAGNLEGADSSYLNYFMLTNLGGGDNAEWGLGGIRIEADIIRGNESAVKTVIYSNPCVNKFLHPNKSTSSAVFSVNDTAVCVDVKTRDEKTSGTDSWVYAIFPATKKLGDLPIQTQGMITSNSHSDPFWATNCDTEVHLSNMSTPESCKAVLDTQWLMALAWDGHEDVNEQGSLRRFGGYFFNADPIGTQFRIQKDKDSSGGGPGWGPEYFYVEKFKPGDVNYANQNPAYQCWIGDSGTLPNGFWIWDAAPGLYWPTPPLNGGQTGTVTGGAAGQMLYVWQAMPQGPCMINFLSITDGHDFI